MCVRKSSLLTWVMGNQGRFLNLSEQRIWRSEAYPRSLRTWSISWIFHLIYLILVELLHSFGRTNFVKIRNVVQVGRMSHLALKPSQKHKVEVGRGFCVVVRSLICVWLFATPWTAACQVSLSFTISWSLFRFISTKSVIPSNRLILYCPLLLPSIFSMRVFSSELDLHIRWPKYWSFRISPSNEYLGLISFRIDWFDFLAGVLGEGDGTPLQYSCLENPVGSPRVRHDWATSLSCIGGGNGNPLQCPCLENPRGRGAWWAAVCGVAQSRTRLKWLSSSSSRCSSCRELWMHVRAVLNFLNCMQNLVCMCMFLGKDSLAFIWFPKKFMASPQLIISGW